MALRLPRSLAGGSVPADIDPLGYEIAGEQAATLGRIASDLTKALEALAVFDRRCAERSQLTEEDRARRDMLVGRAAQTLWHVMIQRELCGLYRNDDLFRDYAVPREVRNRVGVVSVAR